MTKRYVQRYTDSGKYVMTHGTTDDINAAQVYKFRASLRRGAEWVEVAIVPVVHVDAAIVDELDELNARHA